MPVRLSGTSVGQNFSGTLFASTGAHSICAWFKRTTAGAGAYLAAYASDGTSPNGSPASYNCFVGINTTGNLEFGDSAASAGTPYFYTGAAYSAGTWVHLALTFDGSTCRSYVNGAEVNNAAAAMTGRADFAFYAVGSANDFTAADTMLFSYALSAQQVKNIMNGAVAPNAEINWPWHYSDTDTFSLLYDISGKLRSANGVSGTRAAPATVPPQLSTRAQNSRIIRPLYFQILSAVTGATRTAGSAGSTYNLNAAATGQTITGGAATNTYNVITNATGATITGASVAAAYNVNAAATGATRTSGSAVATVSTTNTSTGSTVTAGSAAGTYSVNAAASGSTVTTGAGATTYTQAATVTGATVTTGLASSFLVASATGATITAATVAATYNVNASATGAARTTGAAAGAYNLNASAAGASITTGSAAGAYNVNASATGSTRTAGAVAASVSVVAAALGTTVTSGTATQAIGVRGSTVTSGSAQATIQVQAAAVSSTVVNSTVQRDVILPYVSGWIADAEIVSVAAHSGWISDDVLLSYTQHSAWTADAEAANTAAQHSTWIAS